MASTALALPEEDEEAIGPAMRACLPQERIFVRALVALGIKGKATEAARQAGYSKSGSHGALRVRAHDLTHRPRVQAAIHEEAVKVLGAAKLMAASRLVDILAKPNHPRHFDAIRDTLDRAGLAAKTEHKVTVERTESQGEQVERLVRLAKDLGLDPKALLGRYGVAVPEAPALIEGPDGQPA